MQIADRNEVCETEKAVCGMNYFRNGNGVAVSAAGWERADLLGAGVRIYLNAAVLFRVVFGKSTAPLTAALNKLNEQLASV